MNPSLKQRLLTAAIGIPFVLLLLLSPLPIVIVAVMIVSVMGLNEYFHAVGLNDKKRLCFLGYVAAVVIPLGGYLKPISVTTLAYLYMLCLFALMLTEHKRVKVKDLALQLFGLVYIPYFLSHIIYIRALALGQIYIWMVFLGAFMTDTFAYFVGCGIGKHKLCPEISPKKTIEGAIGGLLGCGLSFLVFGIVVNHYFPQILGTQRCSLGLLFVLGILCGIVSQMGDLVASILKRQYELKDFGKLLPGHGGILDRCDSIILVAPIIFLFLAKIGILVG